MPDDTVMLRFGGDTGMVATALRGLRGLVEKAVEPLSGAVSSAFSKLVIPVTPEGLIDPIRKIMESVKQIERVGEATGLGSEQWQRFAFTLGEVGQGAELGEKGLTSFSEIIGNAKSGIQSAKDTLEKWGISIYDSNGALKDTSALLDDVASRSDTLGSAQEKAAMAQDFFGRGAEKMVAVLSKWKAEHGAGAALIDKDDLATLTKANEQLDVMQGRVKVLLAHGASLLMKVFGETGTVLGTIAGGKGTYATDAEADMVAKLKAHAEYLATLQGKKDSFTAKDVEGIRAITEALRKRRDLELQAIAESYRGQQKIDALLSDRQDMQDRLNGMVATQAEKAKLIVDIARQDVEIARERTSLQQQTLQYARQISEAETRRDIAVRNRREALLSPYEHSLKEIAGNAHYAGGAYALLSGTDGYVGSSWASRLAAKILDAQKLVSDRVLWAARTGTPIDQNVLNGWATQIEQWKQALAQAGYLTPQHTLETLDDNVTQARTHLKELVDMARSLGIPVAIHNSE